jgi:hypothetical protein
MLPADFIDMDLHREIAQWLFAFRLIPASSPALRPNAQLPDLVAVLRDGVVLCQVAAVPARTFF